MMFRRVLILLLLPVLLSGCERLHAPLPSSPRPFRFSEDTFSFPNELRWDYGLGSESGARGRASNSPSKPKYTHRCFVVARSAKQFFHHARFDPAQPKLSPEEYAALVREILKRNPRRPSRPGDRVVITGYAHLKEFSLAHEDLIKSRAGGAWQSYFQRGHWRMVFPCTRRHQEKMAAQLAASLKRNRPPVVHIFRFPQLTVNHALVLFDAAEVPRGIQFQTYDPNDPDHPTVLTYDRTERTFYLPGNAYFAGGRVDVYEIYHRLHF
jgi:hypothetical protein